MTGFWTLHNFNSLSVYTLAKYIKEHMGNIYPRLPQQPGFAGVSWVSGVIVGAYTMPPNNESISPFAGATYIRIHARTQPLSDKYISSFFCVSDWPSWQPRAALPLHAGDDLGYLSPCHHTESAHSNHQFYFPLIHIYPSLRRQSPPCPSTNPVSTSALKSVTATPPSSLVLELVTMHTNPRS